MIKHNIPTSVFKANITTSNPKVVDEDIIDAFIKTMDANTDEPKIKAVNIEKIERRYYEITAVES